LNKQLKLDSRPILLRFPSSLSIKISETSQRKEKEGKLTMKDGYGCSVIITTEEEGVDEGIGQEDRGEEDNEVEGSEEATLLTSTPHRETHDRERVQSGTTGAAACVPPPFLFSSFCTPARPRPNAHDDK